MKKSNDILFLGIQAIVFFFVSYKSRVGFSIVERWFGKYKRAKKIYKEIDFLDSKFKEFDKDFELKANSRGLKVWIKYEATLNYLFTDRRYLKDKGEKALYKELERRRDVKYDILSEVYDLSEMVIKRRENRLSKILDK